jgi:hypothetical protein
LIHNKHIKSFLTLALAVWIPLINKLEVSIPLLLVNLLTFFAQHIQQKLNRWLETGDHDRFGSRSDPTLNGTLHYPNPNDIDRSLNEAAADKIRKYHADYNINPPNAISFIPAIDSTSDRLYSEFIRLLFLQVHRETDRFFAASGVQSTQSNLGSSYFHFRRAAFITSQSHTHPSHSQTYRLLTSSQSLGVPVPRPTQCM